MAKHNELGKFGEDMACRYLEDRGYEILKRNYKVPVGEIDIIALSPEDICVFLEVKTRTSDKFAYAMEAVDRKKQEHIIRAAMTYQYDGDMRFDVIEVYCKKDDEFSLERINHIENAFLNQF